MIEGAKQAKFAERNIRVGSGKNGFDVESKLNLNDLLEKRREEKQKDKMLELLEKKRRQEKDKKGWQTKRRAEKAFGIHRQDGHSAE